METTRSQTLATDITRDKSATGDQRFPHAACRTPDLCRREQVCVDAWQCASVTALNVIDDRSNPPPRVVFLRALAAQFYQGGFNAEQCWNAATEYEEMLAALKEIEAFTDDVPDDHPLSHVCGTARAIISKIEGQP